MNKPYHNDQAYIAGEFHLHDEHVKQTARLASLKINSYKLSLVKTSFCKTREELSVIIKVTLLNYTTPAVLLAHLGFFDADLDN
jgi:hypothetical protein